MRERQPPARIAATGEPTTLEESLAATARGLEVLLRSLEQGGFREAVGPYRDMQLVLRQQRLWSLSNGREDLDPQWRRIASTARAISETLLEFAAVATEIGELDRIQSARKTATNGADSELQLPEHLLATAKASALALDRGLGWTPDERRQRVASLVDAGVVERRGWGRSLSYRLTEDARRRLAAHLFELAARSHPGT
jgi:hypothetical protein